MDADLRRAPGSPEPSREPDPAVAKLIRDEIARGGPITFARFMELALYAPDIGYYTSPAARVGREGDFLTAPETHPIFGAALARLVADTWRLLGEPSPFHVREYGAGRGTLAASILDALADQEPALLSGLQYEAVEINASRRTEFEERVRHHVPPYVSEPNFGSERVLAIEPAAAASAPAVEAGLVIANEFLDAFPVHRVVQSDAGIREIYVTATSGGFAEIPGPPSSDALAARLAAEGVELQPAQRAEIALGVDAWVAEIARWLGRGVAIAIDYGADATELYGARHRAGTLVGYLGHRLLDDPLAAVGRQDLTAHVDFTAVERAAAAGGFHVLGRTTQARFLVSLGLEDLLQRARSAPGQTMADYLALRSGIGRLLDPRHTGGFGVLAFGRGLDDARPLAGFGRTIPPID